MGGKIGTVAFDKTGTLTEDKFIFEGIVDDCDNFKAKKTLKNCKPENCSSSCSRRGRAHFHLRECQGEDKCEAKLHSFVKHSTERFHPFEEKIFDMWLCEQYWNSLNWQAPVEGLSNELCNYICGHYSHKEEYSYCNKKAWHEGSHSFECKHEEGYSSNIIDIVFCCEPSENSPLTTILNTSSILN